MRAAACAAVRALLSRRARCRPWDVETRGGMRIADYGWLKAAGGANAAILMGSLPRYLRQTLDAFPKPQCLSRARRGRSSALARDFRRLAGPPSASAGAAARRGGHRALQYAPLRAWADFLARPARHDRLRRNMTRRPKKSPSWKRSAAARSSCRRARPEERTGPHLRHAVGAGCVVSAPTAVSWLAAAAGVPTLKILYDTSWTSFGQTYEPFAPSCLCMMPDDARRLGSGFRQGQSG